MLNEKVNISNRAYASMLCELEEYPDVETGGILLGYFSKDSWNIMEATDPGKHAVRKRAAVEFDMDYLQHTAEILSRIYNPPLEQIGVWHKHNHCYNPPFSAKDKEMHIKLAKEKAQDIISILFQKKNDAGDYEMRAFRCEESGGVKEIEFEIGKLNQEILYEYMER